MPSTQSVFESHDWPTNQSRDRLTPGTLAFRKPSWIRLYKQQSSRGARALGLGTAHHPPCSCPPSPPLSRPSFTSPWTAEVPASYPIVLKAAPAFSIPATCPGQPSPSLPGLLLPDFAPHILLPTAPEWSSLNQESAAVSLSLSPILLQLEAWHFHVKRSSLCERCGETGLTHSRHF